jgi:23S rRNA (guanine2445-N2)-methyltransferase / 23S rRNA (guanine2069-N7)-methyltransferase
LLTAELAEFGAGDIVPGAGLVDFAADLATLYHICLWSRYSARIVLPVGETDRQGTGLADIRWDEFLARGAGLHIGRLPEGHPLALVGHELGRLLGEPSAGGGQDHTGAGGASGRRAGNRGRLRLEEQGATIRVGLELMARDRQSRVDGRSEGPPPHLAAIALAKVGWPDVARAGQSLVDPACENGTVLIEAAMIAAGVAPGPAGSAGFHAWRGHDHRLWTSLRSRARAQRSRHIRSAILGFDTDGAAVRRAWTRVRAAGLEQIVRVKVRARGEVPVAPGGLGLLATAPFGADSWTAAAELFGGETRRERLRAFSGWRLAILRRCRDARGLVLAQDRVSRLSEGRTEWCLVESGVAEAPAAAESAAGLSATTGAAPSGAEGDDPMAEAERQELRNRLQKNLRRLGRWARREEVSCYRLYEADLPQYAVSIDTYGGEWVHVREAAPPAEIDPERARRRLEDVVAVVAEVLEVSPGRIYLKQSRRQRGVDQYERLDNTGERHEVEESELRFLVNFTDYLDTGLFLDHRLTRRMLAAMAPGRSFLNLFCYTGSATVYAAAGGALRTVSVDTSNTYLAWATENMRLNGFVGEAHRFVRADATKFLNAHRESYSLIFVDPPTFSNATGSRSTFSVQRDHVALIGACAARLQPGGTIVFSTNFRRFRMDTGALSDLVLEEITEQTIPEDFRRTPHVHRCWLIRRR